MNIIKAVDKLLTDGGMTATIKLNRQPDTPTECITIIDTGGMPPDSEIPEVHEPTFQLLVRAETYEAGKAIVDDCRAILHGKIAVEAEGVHFFYITLLNEPGTIGQNEKGAEEFSANFTTKVREA